jgi:hypothetical protein
MGKKGIVKDQERIREKIVRSIADNILPDELILYPEKGGEVTVGEVRRNPAVWNGMKFADPVDPEYNNDKRIAMAMLRGEDPHIHSFAHGGQQYRFEQKTVEFRVDQGNYPWIVDKCIEMRLKMARSTTRAGSLSGLQKKTPQFFQSRAMAEEQIGKVLLFHESQRKDRLPCAMSSRYR